MRLSMVFPTCCIVDTLDDKEKIPEQAVEQNFDTSLVIPEGTNSFGTY
jgi:hypothetical protein